MTHEGRLVVAIPTFLRADRLARLLEELPDQLREAEDAHGVTITIVVIDNDPACSARDVARTYGADYRTQPEKGLAAVRNSAIDAGGDADALVFIDDDEIPEEGWLAALIGVWRSGNAEFVSGRVVSSFAYPLDPWIEAGGFFRRTEFADGAAMPFAATNNLLIDLAFVRAHGLRFDARFGLTGGEDIHFTRMAVAAGARIVACTGAVVIDPVPPERATRQWVLKRAFRVGTTTVRGELAMRRTRWARAFGRMRWVAAGGVRAVAGTVRWATGALLRSLPDRARGRRLVARGSGMCAGALGIRYEEYRSRHVPRVGDALD